MIALYLFDKTRIIVDDHLNTKKGRGEIVLSFGEPSDINLRKLFSNNPPQKKFLTALDGIFTQTVPVILFPKECNRPEMPQIS